MFCPHVCRMPKKPISAPRCFGLRGDLHKGLGHSAEQQVVEFDFVLQDECVQLMRQREHDMEISGSPEVPALGRRSNADVPESDTLDNGDFGTSYRRWSQSLATSRALIDMTAESRGAATHDGAHHLQLLETDSVSMTVDEVVALRAKDVGHLHGGPVHGLCFLFLDRFTVSSLEIGMVSTGLVTACK